MNVVFICKKTLTLLKSPHCTLRYPKSWKKHVFVYKNKDSTCQGDEHHCFCYLDSAVPLLLKSLQSCSHLLLLDCVLPDWKTVFYLNGNPENRCCCDVACRVFTPTPLYGKICSICSHYTSVLLPTKYVYTFTKCCFQQIRSPRQIVSNTVARPLTITLHLSQTDSSSADLVLKALNNYLSSSSYSKRQFFLAFSLIKE